MAIVTTDNQHYTDIAAAIRSKNGTETLYKPSEMAAAIQAISGGGEPEPPDDGKTRLYITIPANAMPDRPPPRNQVPLYIQQSVANGVTIDWGDGTAPETLPGTGAVNTTHTYEQGGDYVISLDPTEGCELGFGNPSNLNTIMGSSIYNYGPMLFKVYIGDNVTSIGTGAFANCYSLTSVIIPNSVISIESSAFINCYSLTSVIIPNSVTNIGEYTFYGCRSLKSVIIPDGVTNIGEYTFADCYSLASAIIPNSVTSIEDGAFSDCYSLVFLVIPNSVISIESSAFSNCYSLVSLVIPNSVTKIGIFTFADCSFIKEYHFLSLTPLTLDSTNVFNNIPSDCIIYVPKGSAEAYKTATNWTIVADHIQEEPDPIVPEILKAA